MRTLLNLAILLPLALWSGSAFFFTVVAAPLLFATVPRPTFAAVVNAVFPVYFALGAGLLGVSTLTLGALAWRRRTRKAIALAGLVGAACLAMIGAATIIEPQITLARTLAGTPEGELLFREAHGRSMIVNAAAMVSALAAWVLIAHEPQGHAASGAAACSAENAACERSAPVVQ